MHAICLWAPAQEAERSEKGEKGRTPGKIENDGVVQKTVHSGSNITWLEKPPNSDVILPGKMGTFQRLAEIKTDVKIRELQAHKHHSFCQARFVKCFCCCCCCC